MELSQSNVDLIFQGFQVRYQGAYTRAPVFYDKFSDPMPSSARDERYAWIDRLPQLQEWLASRVIQNASMRSYVLANRDWELTLELDRNVIQDDQYGVFNPVVDMMAQSAKLWPDQRLVDQLQNGHTNGALYQCHDGQPFYSANHPIQIDNAASAVQQNYWSSGTALNAANLNTVLYTMKGFQGADLMPLGVQPDTLHVPGQLEITGRQILNTTFIAPSAALGMNAGSVVQSNPLLGMADLLVQPNLNNQSSVWYVHQLKGGVVRPYIFQTRQAPVWVYKNRPDDDAVFLRKKFLFGVDVRGAAGISLYFYSAKASA